MYKKQIAISLLTSLMFIGSTYANNKEIIVKNHSVII
jgi:hypothetical protein